MRGWLAAVAVASIVASAVGCTSDGSERSDATTAPSTTSSTSMTTSTPSVDRATYRVAVDPSSLVLPGGTLADGHRVLDGSAAVGGAFPNLRLDGRGGVEGVGWQALLVIDGDPIAVWDAYASDLGIGGKASAVDACLVRATDEQGREVTSTLEVERTLTAPSIEREGILDCNVASTEGVTMRLRTGPYACSVGEGPECPGAGSNHLWISTENRVSAIGYEELVPDQLPRGDAVVAPALGTEPFGPDVPDQGDDWDVGLDHYLDGGGGERAPIAAVPDRWRFLVAPGLLTPCGGGPITVARAPGDPDEVVRVLDERDSGDEPLVAVSGTFDGRMWAGGTIADTGGYYVDQVALDQGDGTSLVLVSECGD